jgi:para-aminobenzoate synthetase/4-amino-4-deoxychorismate lyase
MTPPLPLDFRTPPAPGEALLRQSDGSWLLLQEPLETRSAWRIEEVLPLLDWAECSVNATSTACDSKANRLFAAGYIAYEAAPAFDPALVCYTPQPTLPLAWWCLYRRAISLEALPPSAQLGPAFLNSRLALREDTATTPSNLPTEWPVDWKPTFDYPRYEQKLTELHGHLHEGNSYQANLCLALEHTADSERRLDRDDLWSFFLRHAPTAPGAIWLETEHRVIASASPELFLDRVGTRLHSKPMKGTRPRGSTPREDCRLARDLASHPKDRAENLMIVDMIRNDLGRIALPGSICTENLFMLERYPTVWQMTSTVVAEVPAAATTCSLLQALFP